MSDVKEIINEALDRLRKREQLTETALAERLNVDPVTIWRWRRGEISKSTAALIPLIATDHRDQEQALHWRNLDS